MLDEILLRRIELHVLGILRAALDDDVGRDARAVDGAAIWRS